MTELAVSYGPPIDKDRERRWIRRSFDRVDFTEYSAFFSDLRGGLGEFTTNHVSTGNAAHNLTESGGCITLSTGATNSSIGAIHVGSGGGTSYLPVMPVSGNYYIRFRMKLTSAMDANALAGWMNYQSGVGTNQAFCGYWGGGSLTKWTATFNGTATFVSTVDVDNGTFHTFEQWRIGSTGYFAVDNETPVTKPNVSPVAGNAGSVQFLIRNGATASNRTMVLDAYLAVVEAN